LEYREQPGHLVLLVPSVQLEALVRLVRLELQVLQDHRVEQELVEFQDQQDNLVPQDQVVELETLAQQVRQAVLALLGFLETQGPRDQLDSQD
jgi:hypothetical protein